MSQPISEDLLDRHLDVLTALGPRHHTNQRAVTATLAYITNELAKNGWEVGSQRYGPEPDQVNLTGLRPGRDPGLALVDLGAHWDSVAGSPGADDNASGVAGVLEVARALSTLGPPERGVRLCLFGGEEGQRDHPGFEGSFAHISTVDDLHAAVILEMIGYCDPTPGSQRLPEPLVGLIDAPPAGDFIAVVGDERSAELVASLDSAGRERVQGLGVVPLVLPDVALPLVARSDHVPYWNAGHRAVLVTDTSEYRTPHYHQQSDVATTLDLTFMARVTAMVTAAMVELAGF